LLINEQQISYDNLADLMYISTSFDVMKRYNCYCKTRII